MKLNRALTFLASISLVVCLIFIGVAHDGAVSGAVGGATAMGLAAGLTGSVAAGVSS